jgi:hypothetical protein
MATQATSDHLGRLGMALRLPTVVERSDRFCGAELPRALGASRGTMRSSKSQAATGAGYLHIYVTTVDLQQG